MHLVVTLAEDRRTVKKFVETYLAEEIGDDECDAAAFDGIRIHLQDVREKGVKRRRLGVGKYQRTLIFCLHVC